MENREMDNLERDNMNSIIFKMEGIGKSWGFGGAVIKALSGMNMEIYLGEFISIIGPSGCGKSTLLSILAGLENPSEGNIVFQDQEYNARLGNIGYMHQKDLLLPWRTVLDNVMLSSEIKGISRTSVEDQVLEMMDIFGLKGFEKSYPFQLSGGMRQRVAFLRTVMGDNKLVLLDEPFGALDALTRINMQEWLLQLWESWDKTILLVTHDVEEAAILSDRIYVLTQRPGRVKSVINVDLPRPRSRDMRVDPAFVNLKSRIMNDLTY